MFNDTKYSIWYWNIIEHAKTRSIIGYTEQHHILPRSLGGTDDSENLVHLTAREHFIVHWLLTKMTTGKAKAKMMQAWWTFFTHKKLRKFSSRYYEMLRKSRIGFKQTEETKRKHSDRWKNMSPEKRKSISEKMSVSAIKRAKRDGDRHGANNQAFTGWYVTPWGKFASQVEVAANSPIPITGRQVHKYCKTEFVFQKPRKFPEWKNRTAKEVGFYFVEVT